MSEEKVQLNLKTVGSDPTVHLGKKKKKNRQEKKDNLYFISKYLYTSGQIVVPALARKSLLAATSQACSPSQRPTI